MVRTTVVLSGVVMMVGLVVNNVGRGDRDAATAMPVVEVTAGDFFFRGPDTVAAGRTVFRLANLGANPHHLQIVRLLDDRSLTDIAQALAGNEISPAWLTLVGGPGVPPIGGTSETIVDLAPGRYALLCFINNGDGVRHLMKGMIRPLVVVGRDDPARTAPAADLTIGLDEYSFDVLTPLTAGRHTIKIVNQGQEPHEAQLYQLAPGVTEAEAREWLERPKGPPPATPLGGTALIAPGGVNHAAVTLDAGTVVLICHVPDPKDGRPHRARGMVRFVEVKRR